VVLAQVVMRFQLVRKLLAEKEHQVKTLVAVSVS
jgi:hypothetical protein